MATLLSGNDIILVTPSDHNILNQREYENSIKRGLKLADEGNIVVFGQYANTPSTEFGYIKLKNNEIVEKFIEKPSFSDANRFIKEGGYYHNCGILAFKIDIFLSLMQCYAPDILQTAKDVILTNIDKDVTKIEGMDKFENISIDYALLQKCNTLKCVICDMGWSDFGSFSSMQQNLRQLNMADICAIDCGENLIYSQKEKTIATIGLDEFVIIDTDDALLVCRKQDLSKMRGLVTKIANDDVIKFSKKVMRPWGYFEVLEQSSGYKIKKIVVMPQKRLSLQKHFHRNEHWIVLSGTASISIDGFERIVCANESVYIKMGQTHRLSNDGKIPLVLIEAQVGEYTQEDDIVRIDDDYRRK